MQLVVENLSKVYPRSSGEPKVVLRNISFSAHTGEVLALRGPNGCGKTTLVNLIASLIPPTTGTVAFNPASAASLAVGYVFQQYTESLLPWLTIADNIFLPLKLRGYSRREAEREFKTKLDGFSVASLDLNSYPHQLSGGQQQKVGIARALLTGSPLLILDEPFSSLDSNSKAEVIRIIERIREYGDTLVLLISHDLEDTIFLADRILCLDGSETELIADIHVPLTWPREPLVRLAPEFLAVREEVLKAFRLTAKL